LYIVLLSNTTGDTFDLPYITAHVDLWHCSR